MAILRIGCSTEKLLSILKEHGIKLVREEPTASYMRHRSGRASTNQNPPDSNKGHR